MTSPPLAAYPTRPRSTIPRARGRRGIRKDPTQTSLSKSSGLDRTTRIRRMAWALCRESPTRARTPSTPTNTARGATLRPRGPWLTRSSTLDAKPTEVRRSTITVHGRMTRPRGDLSKRTPPVRSAGRTCTLTSATTRSIPLTPRVAARAVRAAAEVPGRQ